ncbi:uncharacterized protein LOC128546321 [Mercenaria mercenaria]|uniref:uncharacterized protein LOC128546321 n=1 Tax=Mercenaria mercenaria TaxID=6596 RepID=UPI00234EC10C|nr:uncharacterized protein LOC128546321 [Mercenaria mercenaria]
MAVPGKRKQEMQMKDSIGKASDEDYGIPCQPCLFEGNNVAAVGYCQVCDEYICNTCLSVHRKQSATRNHAILEKDNMPKGDGQGKQNFSEPCKVHVKEIVKFYCEGHDVVGCGDCMILDHKACKVDLVADLSARYIGGQKQKEIDEQLAHCVNKIHEAKTSLKSTEDKIAECHVQIMTDMKEFRKNINVYLDKMEENVLKEWTEIKKQHKNKTVEMENLLKSIENEITEINHKRSIYAEESNALFITDHIAKAKLEDLEIVLQKAHLENTIITSYGFQENEDVNHLLQSLSPIGTVTSTKTDETDNIMEKEAKFIKTTELQGSRITGSVIFQPGQLAVVDNLSKSVQLLDTSSCKAIAFLRLEHQPWDVALFKHNEIAITIPGTKKIHFISKQGGVLKERRTCDVEGECFGITSVDEKLIVSFLNPNKIELLNKDCIVLKTIVSVQRGVDLFGMPRYIDLCPSTNNIYVSDYKCHTVTIFTLDGQFLTIYKEKETHSPQGLVTVSNGAFLVASYGSTNVKLISADFDKTKVILKGSDGLKWPLSICFSRKENKLFICNDNGCKIDIYKFK